VGVLQRSQGKTKNIEVKPHRAAQQREGILKEGSAWICDKGVNPEKAFREQDCWQCEGTETPFTRDD